MREILFRGKRLNYGEWKYGSYVYQYGSHEILLETCEGEYGFDHYEVDPSTVGQYTGLTDKNGKRIFEGDVVRIDEIGYWANGIVVFENGYPGGWLVSNKDHSSTCSLALRTNVEVIGNIHDNPELVKEEPT